MQLRGTLMVVAQQLLMILFILLLVAPSPSLSKIRISEVLAHTDPPFYDFIELQNDGKSPVNISGWFLSDSGKNKTKIRIPNGTVLASGEYRSFNILKLTGDRLSKMEDHVYVGYIEQGNYTEVDDQKIYSSINHISYSRWLTSDGNADFSMAFSAEEMPPRYPIVGPFVISEIRLWDFSPGGQTYIKVTCIRGKDNYNINGTATMTTRASGPGYELRLEQQKSVLVDFPENCTTTCTTVKTPPALAIPITVSLKTDESIFLVSGDPAAFAASRGVPQNRVFGPFNGTINFTKGDRIALYGYEGHPSPDHTYLVEKVSWEPKAPWPVPVSFSLASFTIERISLSSYANEPANWKVKNALVACDPKVGGGTCPLIDNCTIASCDSYGVCRYTALACNHPNFGTCYPNVVCNNPAKYGYSTCDISEKIFSHGLADPGIFGVYNDPVNSGKYLMYWNAGCKVIPIDCRLSQWTAWQPPCQKCGAVQNRTRTILITPKDGGIPCGALIENNICNASVLCDVDCVVTNWTEWSPCSEECGGGEQNRTREISQNQKFNGKPCPTLFDDRVCNNITCPEPSAPAPINVGNSSTIGIPNLHYYGVPAFVWIVVVVIVFILFATGIIIIVTVKQKKSGALERV